MIPAAFEYSRARSVDDALSMPFDERASRAKVVRALAMARTPSMWLADQIAHAGPT